MRNVWLERAKKRLETDGREPGAVFERLRVQGVINENGEPTGKLHRWDAFLAIIEMKRTGNSKQIDAFRCLRPVFGLPGSDTIDVCRDLMASYLKAGKKIVTAYWDNKLGVWREGFAVRLSDSGWIQCESVDDIQDNVGSLPEFQHSDAHV